MATKTAAKKRGASKSKTSAKKATSKKAAVKKAPTKKATTKKATAKKKTARAKKQVWKSRAAIRLVEPGSQVDCVVCGERVKFQARMRNQQVICNIYTKGVWERVDHYHADCYKTAKQPYGKPAEKG
ncbi:MAG: hypothetical protein HKN26_15755 [Acidimicrobiales bacterium]|nr:hypothetical protein [Acidimicrobiales bacterium]